ncbi:cation diffusion facilitator family transporter [Limobrevibacterium gyesilva]|uniref:Cation diffusion facilitator family transporter n=1 Tax=Limobrevibacterium gyesilva TaxID=2991712 RepID=A0AA41YR52_9PROT|nr:cation diffusion facilitator family transporter [Limobrevibacterium gyesilva]MCW3477206.1 cation diffusion facilitator family transporter [Limobrevibacterium gyesilva]
MSAEQRHDHGHDHDHAPHGHDHHHHHAPADFTAAFAIGAALNIGFVAAETVYGVTANSVALLADAAHNLGDVLGLLLAWGAAWLARRRPSRRRTYGWGRSTILAALGNAAVLMVSIGAIGVEALRRFMEPEPVAGITVMVVAGIGVAINGVTAWLFSRGHDDLNIRATFLHMVADAAVSAGVVVSAALIMLTGWLWLDPLTSILIVVTIAIGTWSLLRESLNLAVDGVPIGIPHLDVEATLRALPGVVEVHDLHIWGLSTTETALTAHLVRTDSADDQVLIDRACRTLSERYRIRHATLQVETETAAVTCRLRPDHVI